MMMLESSAGVATVFAFTLPKGDFIITSEALALGLCKSITSGALVLVLRKSLLRRREKRRDDLTAPWLQNQD